MKIGILGTGDVGQALGRGFADLGHEVKMGSRSLENEKLKAWLDKTKDKKTSGGTFADAAAFGEVIVIATMWSGTENAIRLAQEKNFAKKVVIDATNPLIFVGSEPPRLALGHDDSGGEQVQRWISDAHVVKAFNSVGNAHMVNPKFPDGTPDMFICGNNDDAKKKVTEICKDFGWPTIDLGGIECSRYLEALAMIWILYYFKTDGWNHAFKLLKK